MKGDGCCCGSGLCSLYKPINIHWMSTSLPHSITWRHLYPLYIDVVMTTWWFGRRSCIRKEQIWAVMCNDPVGCDSLLAPLCSNLSCGVGGVRANCWCRAQTQKFTSSLYLAALPAPLFTASLHNHWCCTRRSCKISTPGTHRWASWDICRANPAPTKGFTDATAVIDTLMSHKKDVSNPMRDQSLMSWF